MNTKKRFSSLFGNAGLGLLACLLLFSSFQLQARTLDCPTAKTLVSDHQQRQAVLVKIMDDFDKLNRGEVGSGVHLESLFAVDPLDEQGVSKRIAELNVPVASPSLEYRVLKGCMVSANDLEDAEAYTAELEERVREARLAFLRKPAPLRLEITNLVRRIAAVDGIAKAQDILMKGYAEKIEQLRSDTKALDALQALDTDNEQRQEKLQKVLHYRELIAVNEQRQQDMEAWNKDVMQSVDLGRTLLKLYLGKYRHESESDAYQSLWQKLYSSFSIGQQQRYTLPSDSKEHGEYVGWENTLASFTWYMQVSLFHFQKQHAASIHLASVSWAGFSWNSLTLAYWLDRVRGEAIQLLRLPVSGLFLDWYDSKANEPNGLGFLFRPVMEALFAVGLFVLGVLLVRRLPAFVLRQHVKMIRSVRQGFMILAVMGLLRFLRPNAVWLPFFLLLLFLPDIRLESPVFLIVLVLLSSIYFLFHLFTALLEWLIVRMHAAARVIVSSSRHEQITLQASKLSRLWVTLFVIDSWISMFCGDGFIHAFVLPLSLVTGWLTLGHYLSQYRDVAQKFFLLHLSSSMQAGVNRLGILPDRLIMPVLFFFSQCLDLAFVLHSYLLVFEVYQKINAKILKIRIEQMQQPDEESDAKREEENESYERWFSNKPFKSLPPIELQNSLLPDINKVIEAWMKGKNEESDILLMGEQGIGKSTLVEQWKASWTSCETRQLVIPAKTFTKEAFFHLLSTTLEDEQVLNVDALSNFDESRNEKLVVIVDGIHNLFIADENGFEAYKALLDCINTRLSHVFWLLVSSRHAANYLNCVFSHRQQFSYIFKMARWSQQDIRLLIMMRHEASRRRMVFDELLLLSAGDKDSTATIAAESRCFNLLWDQSSGNPEVAMALWVNAASKGEGISIHIGVPEKPSGNLFKDFSDDMLFVYASIIIHDNLTVGEAVKSTNLVDSIVKHAFKVGQDNGFLESNEHGRCRVAPLWYIQLVSYLDKRNFLHE